MKGNRGTCEYAPYDEVRKHPRLFKASSFIISTLFLWIWPTTQGTPPPLAPPPSPRGPYVPASQSGLGNYTYIRTLSSVYSLPTSSADCQLLLLGRPE